MPKKLIAYMVLVPVVALLPLTASSEEKRPKRSYYETLQSLLSRKYLKVSPKSSASNVNLIDLEKGALGVLFGESMERLIEVWGKPHALNTDSINGLCDLSIGAHSFYFRGNRLVGVGIHRATSRDAQLKGGINFKSSWEDVKKAFGKPTEETRRSLEFRTENGYLLRFYFLPDDEDRLKLISISIFHPDSGR